MTPPKAMTIRLSTLLLYVLPTTLLAAGIGGYLTYAARGTAGLLAEAGALAAVTVIATTSAWATVRASARGAVAMARTYYIASMLKIMAYMAASLVAFVTLRSYAKLTIIWLLVFTLTTLIGESVWLVRTLRRNSAPAHLGGIDVAKTQAGPTDTEIA